MSVLPAMPALFLLVAGAILLVSRLSNAGARTLAVAALGSAGVANVVLFRSGRLGASGTFDADPLSQFLSGLVLLSLGLAVLCREESSRIVGRLLATGALVLVALSTRELSFVLPAIVLALVAAREDPRDWKAPALSAAGFLASLALLARACGATDLAAVATSGGAASLTGSLALSLVVSSVYLTWVFESRRLLRLARSSLVARMTSSFLLLVAVTSVLVRLCAWLPSDAPLGWIEALALVSLALGSLGMLGSTRVTTFATALSLARGGGVLLALLGGIHGRTSLLLGLAATGVALLFVAQALDGLVWLDDVSERVSFGARLALLVGALSAAAVPPFPGFVATFPLASSLFSEGRPGAVVALSLFHILAGLGALRVVSRAFSTRARDSAEPRFAPASKLLLLAAILATWALGIAPGAIWEIAARAAREMF